MKRAKAGLAGIFLAGIVLGLSCLPAAAVYPERPIQIIVANSAGSNTDVIIRGALPALSKELGQPVVVINQVGASGEIGSVGVKNAAPDGYTVGFLVISTLAVLPNTRPVQYDALKDYDYVCQIYDAPTVLVVDNNSPYKTFAELAAYAKANPKKVLYGSAGPGSFNHINTAGLFLNQGIDATHVPFPDPIQALQAIMGNQIQTTADNLLVTRTANVKALLALTKDRIKSLPDVPSSGELKIDWQASAWGGLVVPKGTPPDIRTKLESSCKTAVADPAFLQGLDKIAVDGRYRNGADFKSFVTTEYGRYGELIKALGLQSK